MKKLWNKTGLAVLGLTMGLSAMHSSTAFAGQWQNQDGRFWWQNDDGSYPVSTWQWLDGDQDGAAEQYYFDENGYLLVSTTTPDQRTVNENGAWVSGGAVQRLAMSQTNTRFGKYDNETNRAALKAYRKALETDYKLQGSGNEAAAFSLLDLNSDGIYEMYVIPSASCMAEKAAYICWYTDGIVSKRSIEYLQFYYKPGTGSFMAEWNYDIGHAGYYQFDGNSVIELKKEEFIVEDYLEFVDHIIPDDPQTAVENLRTYQKYISKSVDISTAISEVNTENLNKYFGTSN